MIKKQIGYIGLGKMGEAQVLRLLEKKWNVVAYNRSPEPRERVAKEGAKAVESIEALVAALPAPRTVWIMTSHQAVEEVLGKLVPLLEKGDTIIDGGNSPYRETMRRAHEIGEKGIGFIDCGVSGGPGGARTGACLMVGGRTELVSKYEDLWTDLSIDGRQGWAHFGPSGAGHFVKMTHNGIEYGMMQAIAEGFDLMRHSKEFPDLDMLQITELYQHGSVVTSRLVGWLRGAFAEFGEALPEISGKASSNGEGAWTFEAGEREGIPMPAIKAALDTRAATQLKPSYQGKVISAMRGGFGHHPVRRDPSEPQVL